MTGITTIKGKRKAVYISEKQLVKGTSRKTNYDSEVKGFTLRTTPNGVFTFCFQWLNQNKPHPKTKKPVREWVILGHYNKDSELSAVEQIERFRNEARLMGVQLGDKKNPRQIRDQQLKEARAHGTTFQQCCDLYIAYCKTPTLRAWGKVAKKESWQNIEYKLSRAKEWWGMRSVSEITDSDVLELIQTWIDLEQPAMANKVRKVLGVMFDWAMEPKQKFLKVNPCAHLGEWQVENSDVNFGYALGPDELRTFWHGLDDPNCPGDRFRKLALKLSLATMLRTGECCNLPRTGVTPTHITIPLAVCKGRKAKRASDIVQPLNKLAREILGEAFSIGDPNRAYAFPDENGNPITQVSLRDMLVRGLGSEIGILEYLGMSHWTPHTLRRTSGSILHQIGYSKAVIGEVLTHKAGRQEGVSTSTHDYCVTKKVIVREIVDPRIKPLNDLDDALREIIGLPREELAAPTPVELPAPALMLEAA
jgi:integrase